MFTRIMVAVDGSAHSRRAVVVASDLATRYDAPLVISHVPPRGPIPEGLAHMAQVEHLVDDAETPGSVGPANVPGALAAARASLTTIERREKLRYAVAGQITGDAEKAAHGSGVKEIIVEITDGDPAAAIVAAAEKHGVDLIVIGSRGLSELEGLLMGSVSHKVCQIATCACVIVK